MNKLNKYFFIISFLVCSSIFCMFEKQESNKTEYISTSKLVSQESMKILGFSCFVGGLTAGILKIDRYMYPRQTHFLPTTNKLIQKIAPYSLPLFSAFITAGMKIISLREEDEKIRNCCLKNWESFLNLIVENKNTIQLSFTNIFARDLFKSLQSFFDEISKKNDLSNEENNLIESLGNNYFIQNEIILNDLSNEENNLTESLGNNYFIQNKIILNVLNSIKHKEEFFQKYRKKIECNTEAPDGYCENNAKSIVIFSKTKQETQKNLSLIIPQEENKDVCSYNIWNISTLNYGLKYRSFLADICTKNSEDMFVIFSIHQDQEESLYKMIKDKKNIFYIQDKLNEKKIEEGSGISEDNIINLRYKVSKVDSAYLAEENSRNEIKRLEKRDPLKGASSMKFVISKKKVKFYKKDLLI